MAMPIAAAARRHRTSFSATPTQRYIPTSPPADNLSSLRVDVDMSFVDVGTTMLR